MPKHYLYLCPPDVQISAIIVARGGEMARSTQLFSVHGRFQPFHNGHFNYVRAGLELAEHLYIGITKINRNQRGTDGSAAHRSQPESNPFSFFERMSMVERTLQDEGIPRSRFTIIPFPHDEPELVIECFPPGNVCYTTIHTEWNNEKIERLRGIGYDVRVLEEPDRWLTQRASGSSIRAKIRAKDPSWKEFVPRTIARVIDEMYLNRF
jgi:cytidyltransferase-like protein